MTRPEEIIIRPVITEKAMMMRESSGRYIFHVPVRASKPVIRSAVEELFKVEVMEVRTIIQHGRFHRVGRGRTRVPNWKKAIVTLKEGQKIDIFEGK